MPNEFFQSLLEAGIVIGVLGTIGIIYWAKATKQEVKTILKKIQSVRLFKTEDDLYETKNKQKLQEGIHQTWPERRTIM